MGRYEYLANRVLEIFMRCKTLFLVASLCWLNLLSPTAALSAPPLSRASALTALEQPSAESRLKGVLQLAKTGVMADADAVVKRLQDDDEQVRLAASMAIWEIWGRSGDKAVDSLFKRGLNAMQSARLDEAIGQFSSVIKKKATFAEAWNKRATVYFHQGKYEESLKDCDEVLKLNANHFGALSGMGQIHIKLGDYEKAIAHLKRALKINPNLTGTAELISILQAELDKKLRNSI
jgi:tetratricopeptide (TPR) repeat protein